MLLCSNNAFRCLEITVLAACLLTAWPISLYAEDSQAKKVLVLHSYHHGLSRINAIDKGIESALKKDDPIIETQTEYLDINKIYDSAYIRHLYEIYKYKFRNRKFDAIICSDNNALNFLLKYSDILFPGTPVVFCGINNFKDSMIKGKLLFTETAEEVGIRETLDIALKLHPGIKHIFIYGSNTTTYFANKESLKKIIPDYVETVDFAFTEGLNIKQIQDHIKALPKNSLILIISSFRDAQGNLIPFRRVSEMMAAVSSVPIYGCWDFFLGHGIIGGKLISGFAQGETAAKITLQILNGKDVKNIPILKQSPKLFMFDYLQMQKFGIKQSELPADSIVINKPYSFYSVHKVLTRSVFASIIILTLIIFFLITNIVTRRQAEKALRESREKMKAILRASPVGIGLVINRKLDWANERIYRMTGYEQGSRIGQSVRILYPDDKEYNRVGRELYDSITKTGIGHVETRLVRKDGTTFDCRIQACNLDPTDSAKGQIIALTNISKTKLYEAQLLQACKMEAVGTLAGGISHDFNNLLQAIMGYTQLLLMNKSKEDPEFFQLKQIEKAGQRSSELTRQLLTFSRNVESKPIPLNLNNEIKRTYTILKRTIPKMIDIELILEDDLKNINADPIQMEQILMNLGVNSRDAMPDGGRLVFETKNVVLDEEYFKIHPAAMPGEYVLLSIADTGFGMNKETMEHIYEPFFTTKEVGKGTGLGLAMVYGIVESNGGYITSYSKPDEGATFRIYFPVLKADIEVRASDIKEEKLQGGSETILLVDDEETVLDIAKIMLERFRYTAITAESGEDAIEIFKKSNPYPDLVILDIGMPGMGGHKCLKELLKIYPDIKVIISSGYPENGKTEKTIESGAAGFIAKPYRLADMLKKVREILDSE